MHTVLHSQSVHKFAGEKHFTMLTIANMIRIDSLLRSALPLLTTDSTRGTHIEMKTVSVHQCNCRQLFPHYKVLSKQRSI